MSQISIERLLFNLAEHSSCQLTDALIAALLPYFVENHFTIYENWNFTSGNMGVAGVLPTELLYCFKNH